MFGMRQPIRSATTKRTAAIAASRRSSGARPGSGRLVLVVSSDPARLDLVLDAVRRRVEATDSRFIFPHRISTRRRHPLTGDVEMSQSMFRDGLRAGSFLIDWQDERGRHAISADTKA